MLQWLNLAADTIIAVVILVVYIQHERRIESLEANATDIHDNEEVQRSINKHIVQSIEEMKGHISEMESMWDKDRDSEYRNAAQILEIKRQLKDLAKIHADVEQSLKDRIRIVEENLVSRPVEQYNEAYADPDILSNPAIYDYIKRMEETE